MQGEIRKYTNKQVITNCVSVTKAANQLLRENNGGLFINRVVMEVLSEEVKCKVRPDR